MDVWFVLTLFKMAFMASLNLADFVTDILVLLRYSCILESDAGEPCAGSVPNSSCQPHPWWTFIGLMILSVSTFLSAMLWANPAAKNFNEKHRAKKATLRDCARPYLHFVVAVIQLSPFVDLVQVAWSGTDAQDPEQRRAARLRDLWIKRLESAPQALFQSYVFFATASHKHPLNILSIAISILSLSLGLVEFYMQKEEHVRADENAEDSADPTRWSVQADVLGAKEEGISMQADGRGSRGSLPVDITRSETMRTSAVSEFSSASIPKLRIQVQMDRPDSPVKLLSAGKFVAFLYMGSDLALRCVAFAVNFSPSARFAGVAIAVSFVCLFILRHPANLARLRARGEICHYMILLKDNFKDRMFRMFDNICRRGREEFLHFLIELRSKEVSKHQEVQQSFETKPVEASSRSRSSICLAVTRIVMGFIELAFKLVIFTVFVVAVIVFLVAFGVAVIVFWVAFGVAVIVFWVAFGVAVIVFLVVSGLAVVLAGCWESFTASSEVVRDCDRWTAQCLSALLFLEYLCHGAVMVTVARNACGERPNMECLVFALLFGFNLCSYVAYAMMQDNVARFKEFEISLEESCLKIVGYLCSCCCGKGRDTE